MTAEPDANPSPTEGAAIRISTRAFVTSALILLGLMLLSGALTLLVPAGQYQRVMEGGQARLVADSFQLVPRPDYPIWRWFTAPLEVPFSEGGTAILVVIAFISIVGGAFSVLNQGRVLQGAIATLQARFANQKYLFLNLISLLFMLIGSVMGIFEETIPLIPIAIALAFSLGWDTLVGLGMSILAVGFGFSAAIANPFSVGVAQKLSGVPLYSGTGFRLLVFALVATVYLIWLNLYARRVERNPRISSTYSEDQAVRARVLEGARQKDAIPAAAVRFLTFSLVGLLVVIGLFSSIPGLSDFTLPAVALLFLLIGLGSGLAAGLSPKVIVRSFWSGFLGIAPGILLILMAASARHIISSAQIMDTILHQAALTIGQASSYSAALLVYAFTLGMNFFIGSATAKAVLLMPILAPLSELVGVSKQVSILAFTFGDGFSNMLYPTNPVLIISLSLTVMSYPRWFKATILLQLLMLSITVGLTILAVAIGY